MTGAKDKSNQMKRNFDRMLLSHIGMNICKNNSQVTKNKNEIQKSIYEIVEIFLKLTIFSGSYSSVLYKHHGPV